MTKPEPLKGKKTYFNEVEQGSNWNAVEGFYKDDVKSAIEWMIAIHEERIEELIAEIKEYWSISPIHNEVRRQILEMIGNEYEAIMILEEGLSDVI